MNDLNQFSDLDLAALKQRAERLLDDLYPLCRSITGSGLRQTLARLSTEAEIEVKEVPTGTKCFDWTIPKEWVIRDAYIKNQKGERIVDFKKNNLHLVNYSAPVGPVQMSFSELRSHLHTLPELSDAIPYRTTYYEETWGFCLSENLLSSLDQNESFEVCVDSELVDGSLSLGHVGLSTSKKPRILISTYCCHPSMGNDNLSGVVLSSLLQGALESEQTNLPYAFAYVPETIGAIAFLSEFEERLDRLDAAFVVSCVGGRGEIGYKSSFIGDSLLDRAVLQTLREHKIDAIPYPFQPDGSDERQYSSPGFRIPCGTICKDKYYEFDYYHTSLDNREFLSVDGIIQCLSLYWASLEKIDRNAFVKSKHPCGELQLGKRGLYPQLGGAHRQPAKGDNFEEKQVDVLSWLMFFADGGTSLLEMSERTEFTFRDFLRGAKILFEQDLIEIAGEPF